MINRQKIYLLSFLYKLRSPAWLVTIFFFGCLALPLHANQLTLTDAQVLVTLPGGTLRQTVSLPYHWDRQHPGLAGEAMFALPFDLEVLPGEPFGLYSPRLGNTYEIWLNGILLQRSGNVLASNGADYAKAPRHMVVPPNQFRLRNLLTIHIRADLGRQGGLSPVILGPDDEVYPLYMADVRLRSSATLGVAIVSLMVGLVALALWLTQASPVLGGRPRRDPLYLYAGLAELCWSVSVSDFLIDVPPLPWPWWGLVPVAMTGAWACWMVFFCIEVAGWRARREAIWLRRCLGFLWVACLAGAAGALHDGYSVGLTLVYGVSGLTLSSFVVFYLWRATGDVSLAHKVVAAVVLLNVAVGVYDLYVMRLSEAYGEHTYLRYFSLLFGLTLAFIVIERFRAASANLTEFLLNLEVCVARKELELAQNYQIVERLARGQERVAERTRILRDMHDGVGAHISTAIRQLESGRATQGEVLNTLRGSLDQLKLSIDAMSIAKGDITALLANLRYRLAPRLKASDLVLAWDVDQLAPLAWLDDKAMRHLQYMVFEALSNVLQHAQATELRIELHGTVRGGARLRVIDNGCGFAPDMPHKRRGLGSLHERAEAICASLAILSGPGKTVVEILLEGAVAG